MIQMIASPSLIQISGSFSLQSSESRQDPDLIQDNPTVAACPVLVAVPGDLPTPPKPAECLALLCSALHCTAWFGVEGWITDPYDIKH